MDNGRFFTLGARLSRMNITTHHRNVDLVLSGMGRLDNGLPMMMANSFGTDPRSSIVGRIASPSGPRRLASTHRTSTVICNPT